MSNIDSVGHIIRGQLLKRGYSTAYSEGYGAKPGLAILMQVLGNGIVFFVNVHEHKISLYVRDSNKNTLSRAEFSELEPRFGSAVAVLSYIESIEALYADRLPGGFDDLPAEAELNL